MSVPPLRLSNNFESYISGEVSIHPSAVLAPGVILQAATNSKIIIGPGACIGMGSILQVYEGTLEVEAGVNLGAGFLMVGNGKIGSNACIGSATTVFYFSVAPGQVVAPGSILGDTSRQIGQITEPEPSITHSDSTITQDQKEEAENQTKEQKLSGEEKPISSTKTSAAPVLELEYQTISFSSPVTTPNSESPPVEEIAAAPTEINDDSQRSPPATESVNTFGTQIYGQGSIQRLLITLFPHRQTLSEPISDNQSE
ncbi:MAG: transferase [Gloeotrichia echinulata GP01]